MTRIMMAMMAIAPLGADSVATMSICVTSGMDEPPHAESAADAHGWPASTRNTSLNAGTCQLGDLLIRVAGVAGGDYKESRRRRRHTKLMYKSS